MKKPLLPILLAVLLAVGAGLAVFFYARGAENRALANLEPVSVMVTTDIIPAGTSLNAASGGGLLESQEIPSKLRPEGAYDSVSSQNGALVALTDLPKGTMIQAADFGTAVPDVVPLKVPAGMLAVTAKLEDPAKVGSFLRPGSEIAIYDTITLPNDNPAALPVRATRLLLDRVQVLAIGPVTQEQEKSASAEAWQDLTVTVAVDQKQAEKLVHGIQTGSLYLALLSDGTTFAPSAGVSDEDLFN